MQKNDFNMTIRNNVVMQLNDKFDVNPNWYHRYGNKNPEHIFNKEWNKQIFNPISTFNLRTQLHIYYNDNRKYGPLWTFNRQGMSCTKTPIGEIYIGGKYEDNDDPDYCIYNDVILIGQDSKISIFGYPKDTFIPLYNHTTTLIDDKIYIIGGSTYKDFITGAHMNVYKLKLGDLSIQKINTDKFIPNLREHNTVLKKNRILIKNGFDANGNKNKKTFKFNLAKEEWK